MPPGGCFNDLVNMLRSVSVVESGEKEEELQLRRENERTGERMAV